MRAVSVPFSPERPSRLKNEPGILPAAYMRSSTSTVSGRKSTSRRLPTVAVLRTMVSPWRTTTAPEACLAILPGLEGDLRAGDLDGDRGHGVIAHMCTSLLIAARASDSAGQRLICLRVSEPSSLAGSRAVRQQPQRRSASVDARRAAPSRTSRARARRRRRSAGRPRSARRRGRAPRRAPTGAGRRCGPGRRTARRRRPRTRPAARRPRRRGASATARGCLAFSAKWRKTSAVAAPRSAPPRPRSAGSVKSRVDMTSGPRSPRTWSSSRSGGDRCAGEIRIARDRTRTACGSTPCTASSSSPARPRRSSPSSPTPATSRRSPRRCCASASSRPAPIEMGVGDAHPVPRCASAGVPVRWLTLDPGLGAAAPLRRRAGPRALRAVAPHAHLRARIGRRRR